MLKCSIIISIRGKYLWRIYDMKPLKQKVSITLDEEIIIKLKELSEKCDRSFSQYVNLVLKEHLKKLETESK